MSAARALKARWIGGVALVGDAGVRAWMRRGPFESDETLVKQGRREGGARGRAEAPVRRVLLADAVARVDGPVVRDRRRARRQGDDLERVAGDAPLPRDDRALARARRAADVRVIYVDGAGCYGMNGHDDAAADAALLSRAVGKPVRVQWTREDELGWDPEGAAAAARARRRGSATTARSPRGAPRCGCRKPPRKLPNIPLLGPEAAGMPQTPGISTGLISQNGNPPYAVAQPGRRRALAQRMRRCARRTCARRARSPTASRSRASPTSSRAAAGRDALEFRLAGTVPIRAASRS